MCAALGLPCLQLPTRRSSLGTVLALQSVLTVLLGKLVVWQSKGAYVRLARDGGSTDEPERRRLGEPHRLRILQRELSWTSLAAGVMMITSPGSFPKGADHSFRSLV